MHPPIIKFRGTGTTDGKEYYGHFTEDENGKSCIILKGGAWREVKPESVVQLICFDKYKNEVYPMDHVRYYNQEGLLTPFRYELDDNKFIPCWTVGDLAICYDANLMCNNLEIIEEL